MTAADTINTAIAERYGVLYVTSAEFHAAVHAATRAERDDDAVTVLLDALAAVCTTLIDVRGPAATIGPDGYAVEVEVNADQLRAAESDRVVFIRRRPSEAIMTNRVTHVWLTRPGDLPRTMMVERSVPVVGPHHRDSAGNRYVQIRKGRLWYFAPDAARDLDEARLAWPNLAPGDRALILR